jgi:outer membrane protein
MKKLDIALFSVLFVAVTALFFLNFSGNKKSPKNITNPSTPAQGIAFVNIDTVIYKFDMFFDRRNDLMTKQKSAEAELTSKVKQFQKNGQDYQDKVNKGLVTRAQAVEIEKSLTTQQQELQTLQTNLQNNLMEEEQVMNRQIVEYITSYLESNKAEYNYQYILGKSFGSVILYGDQGLDITQRVLDAVNKKYQAEKK